MTTSLAELAARIDARKGELGRRSIQRMYDEDLFWEARFGTRGRRFADQDGAYHVTYLVQALRDGGPRRFVEYARWLQVVLTTRGMCTRHVARNFATLAEAIRDEGIDGAEPAIAILDEGMRALRHTAPAAAALQDAGATIAGRAVETLRLGRPDWPHWGDPAREERLRWEAETLLSYAADALQRRQPEALVAHAHWLEADAERRGEPAGYGAALANAIAERAPTLVDGAHARDVAALFAQLPGHAAVPPHGPGDAATNSGPTR